MVNEIAYQNKKPSSDGTTAVHGAVPSPLSFRLAGDGMSILRSIKDEAGREHTTTRRLEGLLADMSDLGAAFDAAWLRSPAKPWRASGRLVIRSADVFSGCGGMTLGACEAAWAIGLRHESVLAIDTDKDALDVFKDNFDPRIAKAEPIESLFDGELGSRLTRSERKLSSEVGEVDLLVAGPPCQGNSDLNNHTRRADPKNGLYARMARCAEVLRPTHVVIENVPGVLHDKKQVVARTEKCLRRLGYCVSGGIVDANAVGVPQMRRRHFLIASRVADVDLGSLSVTYHCPARSLRWAIEDLLELTSPGSFDVAATPSATNRARIAYLFEHGLYDLPDSQRPDCHRLKAHTYRAMYGRLRWDQPAPTITTGFGSPGQGRFIHPLRQRTLTPHEAARVQFFPDFFRFRELSRSTLRALIANAVPSKLVFVIVLELLRKSPPQQPVSQDSKRNGRVAKLMPHLPGC